MATVEEIITRYSADDRYSAKVVAATQKTRAFGSAVDQVHRKTRQSNGGSFLDGLKGSADDLVGAFGEAGSYMNMIIAPIKAVGAAVMVTAGAAAAATIAFAGFAKSALDAYGDLDSLMKGLTAVAGSEEEALRQFQKVREIAKLPGLGVFEAGQGLISLQAAGFSAKAASDALMGFGNALATVGKGKAELDGVIIALTQIAAKGVVSAEEINQIAERLPQIRPLMQAAFGTANTESLQKMGLTSTEFITKLTDELGKLPKVAGGVRNSLENVADATKLAMASAGSAIASNFLPAIEKASLLIQGLSDSGVFQRIADSWSKMFGGGKEDLFVTIIAYTAAVAEALPTLIQTAVQTAQDGIKWLIDQVVGLLKIIAEVTPFGGQAMDSIQKYVNAITDASNPLSTLGFIVDQINQSAQEKIAMINESAAGPSTELSDALSNSPLKQIQLNTKTTADVLTRQEQISRSTLGGGTFGNMGITPVELGGMKRRGRTTVEGAIRYLVAAVEQQTGGAVMQGMLSRARVTR